MRPFEVLVRPPHEHVQLAWSDASFERGGKRSRLAASLHEDAAYFAPGPDCRAEMGALVFDAAAGCFYLSSIVVPSELLPLLFGDKKNYIGPLEALASAAVDFTYPDVLSGRLAIYFVDNQGSLACMVRGSSDDSATSAIAHCAALRQQRQGTRVWYEYVASSANLADLPSRGRLRESARLLRQRFGNRYPVHVRDFNLKPLLCALGSRLF
jgi:hypothetical protein